MIENMNGKLKVLTTQNMTRASQIEAERDCFLCKPDGFNAIWMRLIYFMMK